MKRSSKYGRRAVVIFFLLAFTAITALLYFVVYRDRGQLPVNQFENVRTLSGLNGEFVEPFGIAVKNGEIFASDGDRGRILRISTDGAVNEFAAGLNTPSAIAFAPNGNLIVADTGSHSIKSIDETGTVTLIAGTENRSGFADGDVLQASFNGPIGVAVAPDGKIYVADTYNDRIRLIENGNVTTLAGSTRGFADGSAAQFDTPLGITIWKDNGLLVADSGNRRIRLVTADGITQTLAGNGGGNLVDGLPAAAEFVSPTAVAVNEIGSIYIADGNAIRALGRRAMPFVETISHGRRGFADGLPHNAEFNRPSGLAVHGDELLVADSDNRVIRTFTSSDEGKIATKEDIEKLRFTAEEFRTLQSARWPFDPPENRRDIAGTLGEIRGEVSGENSHPRFHNGLDIAGAYGETTRFIRTETVLDPRTAENFGTSRELLRMPAIGYIHLRLGRDSSDKSFNDPRFQFDLEEGGKFKDVRIRRGTRFEAGEAIGTLNSMNHVHLITGRNGSEMNALDALLLPGISDGIPPVIENISLFDENWAEIETEPSAKRNTLTGRTRIVAKAFDRVDGNSEHRRLAVYRLGYQILRPDNSPMFDTKWTIAFDRMPANEAVGFVYASGSMSGPTGETIFNYIVTNEVNGGEFREGFIDANLLAAGKYILRIFAADFFGNTATKDISFEVIK